MWLNRICVLAASMLIIGGRATTRHPPLWRWSCVDGKCEKMRIDPQSNETVLSMDTCKMFCQDFGLVWPKPTGESSLGFLLTRMNIQKINIHIVKHGKSSYLMLAARERFNSIVLLVVPNHVRPKAIGKSLDVYLVNENPNITDFSLDMDESYELRVGVLPSNRINATIRGNSFFGVRHGLETLSQLVIYDDIRNHVLMARDVIINDKPAYPYRGLLLDTARSYISVDTIKKTIDAMASVKLNTFHWHITDTQSFPFVSEKRPNLSKLGAYSPDQVYTKAMMRDVVQFALERGVRVLPEIDAPAHVGEGWQDTDLLVCFNVRPWHSHCVEPPCGQFNPIKDELYNYLEDLYSEMVDIFHPDIFHIGGDEVSMQCWKSSMEIQEFMTQHRWGLDYDGFLHLWQYFQNKSVEKVFLATGKKVPLITFSNSLTDPSYVEDYLDKKDYIVQMWTTSHDPAISGLLEKGYRLILSNYDALYFDCGFGAWLGAGNNWCSPYIGWQKVCDSSAADIALSRRNQIIGGEAALWTEQIDGNSIDDRLWPRAAAFAERYWSEPENTWEKATERMLNMRERLVRMGVQAELLKPKWCYLNEGYC